MIVYMEGAKQSKTDYFANGIGSFKDMKIAVLIDEFSGSASEIFAGAIQDNDRGVIIGRRSFGKGLVQRPFGLNDGSELRITIARYYTPSGRCIQKPYKRGNSKDYDMDLLNRYNHGEFYNQDSIKQNEKLEYKTKSGRKVYGGGGIMPDIFVKNDTLEYSKYFKELVNKGLIYKFALQYTEKHRNDLETQKTWQELANNLRQKDIFKFVVNYGERNGVFGSAKDKDISHKLIETQVIAYVIRNILSDKGFFPYYNQSDKCVQKAVEELSK
jgi:carboxyl-terminal processing protease